MDLVQQVVSFWVEMISGMDPGLKCYLIRIAIGLLVMQILAVYWVRRAGVDDSTAGRQIIVISLGIFVILCLPAHVILEASDALQVTWVTFGLWIDVLLPYILASHLIRTYGRQILARRVIYTVIVFGVLVQLAISGGN